MAVIDLTWARVAHANFRLSGGSIAARGLSGRPQVVAVENRYWLGQVDFPALTPLQAQHMRAAGDRLAGLANALRVAVPNGGPETVTRLLSRSVVDLDRLLASGLPGAGDLDAALAALDPVTTAAGSVGASSLSVGGTLSLLRVGAFFSVSDRLYRVAGVAVGVVEFNPPLRAAVASGVRLRVARPTVALRLVDADGWQVMQDYGANGRPMTVQVEEAFDA